MELEKMSLQELRESKGVTATAVAQAIGIHKTNYSRKENGKVAFSLEEGFKLAKFFGVPVEAIQFPALHDADEATSQNQTP